MSEEKLICGCGGDIKTGQPVQGKWVVECSKCKVGIYYGLSSEAEAIAAFKLATRTDQCNNCGLRRSVDEALNTGDGVYRP